MGSNETDDILKRKQHIEGVFGRAASTYDRVGPKIFSYFGNLLVDKAKISHGSQVLDAATGRGAVLFPAAEAVGRLGQVVGIDFAKPMVQETNKELARRKVSANHEVRQMDAEDLQFLDESFDFVLCGFAIFFFPQLDRAMSEFRRVLKPNGYICVSTWDKIFDDQWSWLYEIVKAYLPPEPESDQPEQANSESGPIFDTPEGLTSILDNAGYENIQIYTEGKDFIYSTKDDFWSTLWSHGMRGSLERIEESNGKAGLEKFKADVYQGLDVLKKDDGFHQMVSVIIGLASKPQD
jgi:ubiquinone/menaquinone biosynthesis C-methylase UbiE